MTDMRKMTPEEREAYKDEMRRDKQARYAEKRVALLEAQKPSNMKSPMTFRIKEWNGVPVVAGTQMVDSNYEGARKLLPGEVVCLDTAEDWVQEIIAGEVLEPTTHAITRPVIFPSKIHAKFSVEAAAERERRSDPNTVNGVEKDMREIQQDLIREYRQAQKGEKKAEPPQRAEMPDTSGEPAVRRRQRKAD